MGVSTTAASSATSAMGKRSARRESSLTSDANLHRAFPPRQIAGTDTSSASAADTSGGRRYYRASESMTQEGSRAVDSPPQTAQSTVSSTTNGSGGSWGRSSYHTCNENASEVSGVNRLQEQGSGRDALNGPEPIRPEPTSTITAQRPSRSATNGGHLADNAPNISPEPRAIQTAADSLARSQSVPIQLPKAAIPAQSACEMSPRDLLCGLAASKATNGGYLAAADVPSFTSVPTPCARLLPYPFFAGCSARNRSEPVHSRRGAILAEPGPTRPLGSLTGTTASRSTYFTADNSPSVFVEPFEAAKRHEVDGVPSAPTRTHSSVDGRFQSHTPGPYVSYCWFRLFI